MVILELAVQGVKGLAPTVRIAFKQGYTLLQAQSAGGSLWKLIDALCYADGRGDASALIAPGAAQARAGLTFQGRDGQTYRLVRELGGSGTLARMDAATGKFLPVTSDSAEIAQYLRSTCGLPTRGAYEQAFSIVAGTWPSQQKSQPAAAAAPTNTLKRNSLPPGAMSAHAMRAQVQPATDVNAARALIAQLQQELAGVKESDELQFQLDGLQKRIYEGGAKLRELDGLRKEVAEAEAAVQAVPSPQSQGLPENIGERAARFEQLEKQRDDQLKRLEREREQFLGRELSVPPLYKQVPFAVSAGLGVLFLALGFVLRSVVSRAAGYVSLLDIPAFGMAAVYALRWVGELQGTVSLSRRKAHYDEREKQINDQFENEVLSVKTAMKVLNVGSPGELIDLIAKRQLLEHTLEEARTRIAALENDPAVADALRDVQTAQAEQGAIEARLGELSGFSRPTHVVEAEIDEIQASIDAALNPSAVQAAVAAPAAQAAPATTPAPGEDPIPRLLGLTTDLFGLDVASLAGVVAPRAGQYLAALSERRLSAVELGHQGNATVITAAGKVAAGSLEPRDRDLLFLATKIALMEKYAERAKLPYLVDDAFAQFAPNQVALIGRVLKHLGTRAQVLHLTPSRDTEALADARHAV